VESFSSAPGQPVALIASVEDLNTNDIIEITEEKDRSPGLRPGKTLTKTLDLKLVIEQTTEESKSHQMHSSSIQALSDEELQQP
jgi:hypothetical protein